MAAHNGRLLLTPGDDQIAFERVALVDALRDCGLIGEPLGTDANAFLPGPGFLGLITFTGCAVQICTDPSQAHFSHIRLLGPFPRPLLYHGRNARAPRCPSCGKSHPEWRALVAASGEEAPSTMPCAACGDDRPAWEWDWRGHAGCGRVLVAIEEVFPAEGIPSPALLGRLRQLGGGDWRHFYVQDAEGAAPAWIQLSLIKHGTTG